MQAREIVRDLDRGDHLAHRLPLEGEEAPFRDDPDELPAVAYEEVPDAVTRHEKRRLVQRRARRQVDRVRRHVGADRPIQHEPFGGGVTDEIAFGEDAQRRALGIDDRDRADPLGLHALERLPQRRFGAARHRRAPDRRRERLQQRPVADGLRGVGGTRRPARLLEQAVHVPGAEALELRARAEQRLHVCGVELVAEEVLGGLVEARRGAGGEDGVDREHLPRRELERHRAGGRIGRARADMAALDDEERLRDARRRGPTAAAPCGW